MDNEKAIERALRKAIKQNGGLCIKLLPFEFGGLPDRLCLMPGGIIFFVEVKTTGEKVRKLQAHVIGKIRNLGFAVYVLDTKEGIKQIIKNYESRKL